ncbi:hypothetical protein ACU639_15795 [Streptomyces cynarae]|uniref:hypothetical protein n=1 Tax=Streptomyces cynarae TaxID=2981134 RepID=UPI00406CC7AC
MPGTTPSSPRPVALVTGAGGRTVDIGAAVARRIARTGWDAGFTRAGLGRGTRMFSRAVPAAVTTGRCE